MLTILLAWRNLWRQKRRTVLNLAAVAFASGILIFFMSIQLSSYDGTINASVSVLHGHLQIQALGYLDEPQIRKTIPNPKEIQVRIDNLEEVKTTAIRSIGFALLSSNERSIGVQVVGVEPLREVELSTIPGLIRAGRYLDSFNAEEAVVGKELAQNLKIQVGEELTLLGQGRDGSLVATVLTVVGVFESGSADIDRSLIEIPLGTFQDIFYMGETAHAIVIRLFDLSMLSETISKISTFLNPSLVALDWDKLLPGLRSQIDLDRSAAWLFYFSLIVVVSFSTLNTFVMSVTERLREFGIMLSLGSTPLRISGLILVECLLLVLLGITIGVILGTLVTTYFHFNGFSIPGAAELARRWNLPVIIYPRFLLQAYMLPTLTIAVVSFTAMIYPIYLVLKLEAIQALRAH